MNADEKSHPVDIRRHWLILHTLVLCLYLQQQPFITMACQLQIEQHLRKI